MRLIRSGWSHLRHKFHCSGRELPEGRVNEAYDKTKHGTPPEGLGQHVYRHATIENAYFWLPVPIATVTEHIQVFSPQQTPYISCMTKRGWFSATQFPRSYFSDHERTYQHHLFMGRLLDRDGNHCGRLYLQAEDDILQFPDVSKTRWKPEGEDLKASEKLIYEDVYGVLWVQWNGVAYRRASGFVAKDAWEAHCIEDVELIMG
ncbi:hypothetical protein BX600DRAFT_518045 [Xylariales sp. PMI_506]|nr:hypothetical protein BX600DRAFT_518045 [Xylariales sp. PMI_506]